MRDVGALEDRGVIAKWSNKLLQLMQKHHDHNIRKPDRLPLPVKPKPEKPSFHRSAWALPGEPLIGDICRAVCQHFDMTPINLQSERRQANIVYARQIAMYLAREMTTRSLPFIGRQFGGRDHTTVLHGCRKIERLIKADWLVAYDVAHIEELLG